MEDSVFSFVALYSETLNLDFKNALDVLSLMINILANSFVLSIGIIPPIHYLYVKWNFIKRT